MIPVVARTMPRKMAPRKTHLLRRFNLLCLSPLLSVYTFREDLFRRFLSTALCGGGYVRLPQERECALDVQYSAMLGERAACSMSEYMPPHPPPPAPLFPVALGPLLRLVLSRVE